MMVFYKITSVVFISLIISFVVLRIKNLRDKHISRSTKLSRRISFEPKKLNNSLDIVLKKKSIKYEKYQKYIENRQDKYANRFIMCFLYNIQKALENKEVVNCDGVYKILLSPLYTDGINGFDLSKSFEKLVYNLEKEASKLYFPQKYFNISTWKDRWRSLNWNPETIKCVSDQLWNKYGFDILNVSDHEIAFVRRNEYGNLCPELQEILHVHDPERFPEVKKGFMVTVIIPTESDGNSLAKVKSVFYTPKEFEVKYPNDIYPEYSIIEKVYGNRHTLIHHYKDLSPKGEYIKR